MLNATRPGAHRHLQLGAGVFLTDYVLDAAEPAAEARARLAAAIRAGEGVLGLTRGGGAFRCVPRIRFAEADGQRLPAPEGVLVDGWQISLSGTLLELRPEALVRLLPGARLTASAGGVTLTVPEAAPRVAPIDRLLWVGDTASGLLAIELRGAVPTAGTVLAFADHAEGTVPFTFVPTQPEGEEALPVRLIYLYDA